MAKAFKLALAGYNAQTDTNPDHFALYVDQVTDYILVKEALKDTITVNANSHTNIAHNLGYVPYALAFVSPSVNTWRKLFSAPIDNTGYYFTIDSTNLVLYNNTGTALSFAYHIFYDNIT